MTTPHAAAVAAPVTEAAFHALLLRHARVLVEVTAPGCVACELLRPVLADVAPALAAAGVPLLVLCAARDPAAALLRRRLGVRQFPTFLLYDARASAADGDPWYLPRDKLVSGSSHALRAFLGNLLGNPCGVP